MTISGAWILFVVLAGGTIAGGVMLLLLRKVVHMMMSLVLTFVSLAGIYVFLSAEFMAVVQILLYSGAVTIMLLFGLMLSKDKEEEPVFTRTSLRYVLVTLSTIGFGVMVYAGILQLPVMAGELTLPPDAVAPIGKELFTKYFIPFELTSVVLLASLVGAVILAKKEGNER
jgi:NADH-quinone oxidoreductase subunit J